MNAKGTAPSCPKCGVRRTVVAVHGQATCPRCGADVTAACEGADAADEALDPCGESYSVPTDVFERLFRRLAHRNASVTTDALLFALVELQGVDRDGAQLLLEAGEHTRAIAKTGPDSWRLRRRRKPRPS